MVNNALRPGRFWKPVRSVSLILLGLLISVISVGWIARSVDLDRLSGAFQAADVRWLLTASLAVVITFFTRTRRWVVLLRPLRIRALSITLALLTGQLLNFVLPIRLGDIIRSMLLGRAPDSSFARVLGSVAIEKAWDWLTLCSVIAAVMLSAPLPAWFIVPARTVGLIAVGVLLAFVVAAALPRAAVARGLQKTDRALSYLPTRWRTFLIDNAQRLLASLTALQNRSTVVGTAAWSLATWSLGIVANYGVMRAYGVDSWSAAMLLIVVLMIGVALPPSIAAIGLFEGLTILTLSAFNIPIELALAIGIALHVIIFVPPLIALGALLLLRPFTFSGRRSS